MKKFATYNTEKTLDLDLTQPRFSYLFEVKNLALYIPNERSLLPQLPENITKDPKVFPDDLPTIIGKFTIYDNIFISLTFSFK